MTIKQNGGIFGRKPTFSTLDVDSSETGTALTVTSSGSGHNIDMVDSTATARIRNVSGRLHITADVNDESASSAIRFYVDNNRKVDINSSGNIVFNASGQGIDFSATSDASGSSSELFDDYEEGTFTPTLYGNSTAGTYELATASGTYTKVGRVVTAQVLLVLASSVTGGGSGDTVIGGLPFNYDGSENPGQHSAVASGGVSFAAGATVTASKITSSDDNRLTLYESVAGTSIATVPITDFGANDLVSFTVTYFSI